MIFDLTIRPEDHFLALWWNEIPAGKIEIFPRGGHRLATARRINPGTATQSPVWMIEDCGRAVDGAGEWRKHAAFVSGTSNDLLEQLNNRQRYYRDRFDAQTGGIVLFNGGGAGFLRALEHSAPLPAWLSVLVIERKPAGVAETP